MHLPWTGRARNSQWIGRRSAANGRRPECGIIGAGLFLWTLMTAGCGVAKTYTHFVLLRIGVGVGEASLSPSAYSMITDYFPKHKLARALSVYAMGISMRPERSRVTP